MGSKRIKNKLRQENKTKVIFLKINGTSVRRSSHDDPLRINAWRRLCATWVSSGVPDMTIVLSVVAGRVSRTITLAPEI